MRRPPPLSLPVDDVDKYELICRAASNYTGYSISKPVRGLFKIYGLTDKSLWAVVSQADHEFFSQWKWSYARSPWGKIYLCRRTTNGIAASKIVDGHRVHFPTRTIYLHREILLRSGRQPPSPDHKIVGHKDGNSLNCLRDNLRWSTYSENNTDQHGRSEGDEEDFCDAVGF